MLSLIRVQSHVLRDMLSTDKTISALEQCLLIHHWCSDSDGLPADLILRSLEQQLNKNNNNDNNTFIRLVHIYADKVKKINNISRS